VIELVMFVVPLLADLAGLVSFYESAGNAIVANSSHELSPGTSISCIIMRKVL
jgi:hypothetical protein